MNTQTIDKRNDRTSEHYAVTRGFSLVELVVVLLVMVATAVIVLPMMRTSVLTPTGEEATANEISTRTTLNTIREAIVGDKGVLENLAHEPDALPREVSDLVDAEPPQHLKDHVPQLATFNSLYGVGWKGPYMEATGKNDQGQPTLLDGWGREIELQVDFDENGEVDVNESRYIRLVSAGPNGRIDTPSDISNMQPGKDEGRALTLSDCGDDMVVFLCVPDQRQ